MALDGLTDAYDHVSMGESTERLGADLGISRAEQDEFAALSHQRAAAAVKNGVLAEEIVGVPCPAAAASRCCSTRTKASARTPRPSRSAARPAFTPDGTITAGSASQISDGAAAVVVMARAKAEVLGAQVLAEVGAAGVVAGPDNSLHSQPSNAIRRALAKGGLTVADLDLIEINEAFAMVAIQSMRDLGWAGPRQRQRRRDRAGAPDRGVRRPDRAAPGL